MVLLCSVVSFNVLAGDPAAGEAKAVVCASCHGPAGNSVNPEWPKLAGQHAGYTAKQIHDFKAGATRSNALMAPMIAGLSDRDIEDISAYYAAQSSTGGFASEELHAPRRAHLPWRQDGIGGCRRASPATVPEAPATTRRDSPAWPASMRPTTAKQLEDWRTGNRGNDPNGMMADAVRLPHPAGDEGGQRVHRGSALSPGGAGTALHGPGARGIGSLRPAAQEARHHIRNGNRSPANWPANRCFASDEKQGSGSAAKAFRPISTAATDAVHKPPNGSRIVSPCGDCRQSRRMSADWPTLGHRPCLDANLYPKTECMAGTPVFPGPACSRHTASIRTA